MDAGGPLAYEGLAAGGVTRKAAAELLGANGKGGKVNSIGEAEEVSIALLAGRLAWRAMIAGMTSAEGVDARVKGAAAGEGMWLGSSVTAVGNGGEKICADNEDARLNALEAVGTSGPRTVEVVIA